MKAYRIADNKLAENSSWDSELLSAELFELHSEELDFELTDIGFDMTEINMLLGDGEVVSSAENECDAASEDDVLVRLLANLAMCFCWVSGSALDAREIVLRQRQWNNLA